jgi:hypothetical protein
MFPGEDLLQEGIAAFQAGDRPRARELLQEVIKVDPENEQAWYYLAACESDPAKRRQYLEQVLEINPTNAKAREVLERIKSRETVGESETPMATPSSSSGGDRRQQKLRALDPELDAPGAAPDEPGSFRIPVRIPGAPARTTWERLFRDGVALLRVGSQVVLRTPGTYSDEVARATWWRFWLITGIAAVGSGILSFVNALWLQARYSGSLFNIIGVLLTPFFFVAFALITLFVGCYASHRYALIRGGTGSLLSHAYTVAVVWAPILLLNSVIRFVFNLFAPGGGWIMTLLLWAYSILLISEGFERLHVFSEPREKWITAGVMIGAEFVASILLSLIFGGLFVGAMPFAF